jgi:regulator of protease activity HflC (stomatin/prohibitin superfamily)
MFVLIVLVIVGIFVLITVVKTMYTVRTYTAGVVERFGKFNRIAQPGLHLLVPWCETVRFMDLQIRQADVNVETKSKDNVFVTIPVSVQYQVLPDKVFEAYYKLSSPQKQIESYVFNSILGHVPTLTLDEAFEQQAQISAAVKRELDAVMSEFGYNILKALVTDMVPDAKVKAAMNDINAAQREQTAAQARGEAEKILKVKQAEAEAQSKALQGEGVAKQRQAIIQGLQASVEQFQTAVEGSTARDVMSMVLLTQYFDTLRDIGTAGRSNTILLPNNPGAVNDLLTQIMAGLGAQNSFDGNSAATPSPVTTTTPR